MSDIDLDDCDLDKMVSVMVEIVDGDCVNDAIIKLLAATSVLIRKRGGMDRYTFADRLRWMADQVDLLDDDDEDDPTRCGVMVN